MNEQPLYMMVVVAAYPAEAVERYVGMLGQVADVTVVEGLSFHDDKQYVETAHHGNFIVELFTNDHQTSFAQVAPVIY